MSKINWSKVGLFAGGVLFGTAGIKALTSKDAKNVYVQTTAATLRAKECVMDTVAKAQDNCNDILEEAKKINEERAKAEEAAAFEDAEECEEKADEE